VNQGAQHTADAGAEHILRRRLISGIPAVELSAPPDGEKRPLVIMIHGLEAAKEHVLPYAYRIAQAGFHAVFFDAREHGERTGADFQAASPAEKRGRLYDIIQATAGDIDTVIDDFIDHPRADAGRIGLMGFSMGGMIVYRYVTGRRWPGVRAAVPVIATPAFSEQLNADPAGDPSPAAIQDRRILSRIGGRDPAACLSALRDLPLLILNGTADEHMPIEPIRRFYRQAKKLYGRKTLIRMVEYDGVGHIITPEMMTAAVDWLKRYL
jgi:dienelactone hydrolase